MAISVTKAATLPPKYGLALDEWTRANLGKNATAADAIRALIADATDLPRLPLTAEKAAAVEFAREERGETICRMSEEGLSLRAIGHEIGVNPERVRQLLAKYKRKSQQLQQRAATLR